MKGRAPDVLVSGASVAGPTVAYWLSRYGFNVTVVERTPASRAGRGGHAVDLFGPAVDVAEWMGILPQVMDARTRTEVISLARPGRSAIDVDLSRLVAGISDRHVEIMRGELASILHQATQHDVEYVFGDSIRESHEDAGGIDVTFDSGTRRRFDLVIGADGLHSLVRRLTFGDESSFRRYLGGYIAFFTIPNHLALDGRMLTLNLPGKIVGIYPVRRTGQARAGFMFRRDEELRYDHRDVTQQKRLLHEVFDGQGWEVPRLLAAMADAPDFYFDSISQIVMDTWSRGRTTLVGDAGYSPGPAVGGGTSLAVIAAYVLADALRQANCDHTVAFRDYENRTRELVIRSRTIGPSTMKSLIPRTRWQVSLVNQSLRLLARLPGPVQRKASSLQGGAARTFDAITLAAPPGPGDE